jgi:glycosyltransferase involved in cell wall biosynthesis
MRKINVLHLRSSNGIYGAERVILTVLEQLSKENIQSILVCFKNKKNEDSSFYQAACKNGIKAYELECGSRVDLKAFLKLVSLSRESTINIIHTHDYKSHFYGICASFFCRCSIISTLHGWTSDSGLHKLYRTIEATLLKKAKRIIVVSNEIKTKVKQLNTRVVLIPNGVNDKIYLPNRELGIRKLYGFSKDEVVFGMVARMTNEKGHLLLLNAFANVNVLHPNTKLLLVGDGQNRAKIESYAKELGIYQAIVFTGTCSNIVELLNSIDCYISASYREAMPMSVLEAMACGLPVIATEVGELPHMLRDGAGRLTKVGDVDNIAVEMISIINNRDAAKKMGNLARFRVEHEYSARQQALKHESIYQGVGL